MAAPDWDWRSSGRSPGRTAVRPRWWSPRTVVPASGSASRLPERTFRQVQAGFSHQATRFFHRISHTRGSSPMNELNNGSHEDDQAQTAAGGRGRRTRWVLIPAVAAIAVLGIGGTVCDGVADDDLGDADGDKLPGVPVTATRARPV